MYTLVAYNHELQFFFCWFILTVHLNFACRGISNPESAPMLRMMGSGVDNWSYMTCKAPVKSSPPTNQYPGFYRPDANPVAEPIVSEHWINLLHRWHIARSNGTHGIHSPTSCIDFIDFISHTAVFSDFFLYLFYSMFLHLYSLSAVYFIPVL